jgi:hypothetical protein
MSQRLKYQKNDAWLHEMQAVSDPNDFPPAGGMNGLQFSLPVISNQFSVRACRPVVSGARWNRPAMTVIAIISSVNFTVG